MKKLLIIILLVLYSFLFVGCQVIEYIYYGDGTLKVVLDWEQFEGVGKMDIIHSKNLEITHYGARVVYPIDGASWTQHVERSVGEKEGIITFQIPAINNAKLFVAGVYIEEGSGRDYVLEYGLIEGFSINEDEVLEITADQLDWFKPLWYPDEGYVTFNDLVGGVLNKDNLTERVFGCSVCDEKRYSFPIYVFNPFQKGQDAVGTELYIQLAGMGIGYPNQFPDEYHIFTISTHCKNDCFTDSRGYYGFQPYLAGSLFGLPGGIYGGYYYVLPDVPDYIVEWD